MQVLGKVKRIWYGDYMHCTRRYKVPGGVVLEHWGEDKGGNVIARAWIEAKVGNKLIMCEANPLQDWGNVARFITIDEAAKRINELLKY